MSDNGMKVALIVMVLLFLLFGGLGFNFMAQVGSNEKEGSIESQLQQLKAEKIKLKESIADLDKKIEEQNLLIAESKKQKEIVVDHVERLRVTRASLKTHADMRRSYSESLQSTESRVSQALEGEGEENAPTIQALRAKKEEFAARYRARREKLQTDSDDITKEKAKQALRYRQRMDDKRRERDKLETDIVGIREDLQKYMVRDLPEVDMGHDGIVLTVDIESRQAVINIGRRQGVKCGMRFEVFRFQQGNRRIRKGYLTVRNTGRETSSCIIVDMAIRLPRCPADGYTARYPEERFCPYCTGSKGGARIQRLSGAPKEANLGMDQKNPIVAGDLVQNPLYDPGKKLHFAVKGEAEDPVSRKWKDADFIAAIKRHGGVVDADVSAQTDVLLVGKCAMDAVRKARELGIRVLHQYEVFDFLRQ